MAQRKYPVLQDFNGAILFGLEDGAQFTGIIVRNAQTINNINKDGSSGVIGEMGVRDSDNFTLNALATYDNTHAFTSSANADQTITFSGTAKQVLIDNQGSTNKLFYELADVAASASSPFVAAGGVLIIGMNSAKIHGYGQTPNLAVVRAWY